MEKVPIKEAAEEMTDDKKLPPDSEMQKAVEQAKAADGAKRPVTPAGVHSYLHTDQKR